MKKHALVLFTIFFSVLLSQSVLALGFRDVSVRKKWSEVYSKGTVETLASGLLPKAAFAKLNTNSVFKFGIGENGNIFLRDVKSGKVFRLNADSVFELVGENDEEQYETIVYSSAPENLYSVAEMTAGHNLGGLEYDTDVTVSFWEPVVLIGSPEEQIEIDLSAFGSESDEIERESTDLASPMETKSTEDEKSIELSPEAEEIYYEAVSYATSPLNFDFEDIFSFRSCKFFSDQELCLSPQKKSNVKSKKRKRCSSFDLDFCFFDPKDKDGDRDNFGMESLGTIY